MLSAAERLIDKPFSIRLSRITRVDDAIFNDAMYHNLYWAKAKKKAEPKVELVDNYLKTIPNIELISFIENRIFQNPDIVFDMNFLNTIYHAILIENDADP